MMTQVVYKIERDHFNAIEYEMRLYIYYQLTLNDRECLLECFCHVVR